MGVVRTQGNETAVPEELKQGTLCIICYSAKFTKQGVLVQG